MPWHRWRGVPGSLSLQRREGPLLSLPRGLNPAPRVPSEWRTVSKPWVKHFCCILSKSNAYLPRNSKLPSCPFLYSSRCRAATSARPELPTGCGLAGFSFQGQTGSGDRCHRWQRLLPTTSSSLVEASKEDTAMALVGGGGASESPRLAEFIQSHPKSITYLTS